MQSMCDLVLHNTDLDTEEQCHSSTWECVQGDKTNTPDDVDKHTCTNDSL